MKEIGFSISGKLMLYILHDLQVNFFDDHTKVIVSAETQDYLVTYIDAKRHSVSYQLLQLRHFGCSVHVVDRLKYARHVLQTVINIAGEPV